MGCKNMESHNPNYKIRKKGEELKHEYAYKILKNVFKDCQIKEANLFYDTKLSTDLLVKAIKNNQTKILRVALRIRTNNCNFRDLTIRSSYYDSNNTEINKLQNTHLYLYIWSNGDYILVNTKKLLESDLINKYKNKTFKNIDDKNTFIAIPYQELLKNKCLISWVIK